MLCRFLAAARGPEWAEHEVKLSSTDAAAAMWPSYCAAQGLKEGAGDSIGET